MRKRPVSLILALLWAAAPAAIAASADEARVLINRMNQALDSLSYRGELHHKWIGGGEALSLFHANHNDRLIERVVSLDGSRNEIVRIGSQHVEYYPAKRLAIAQTRTRSFGFIATLKGLTADSEKYYAISNGGTQRLLGWSNLTQYVAVEPTDALRYGFRFWLDQKTFMPVKTQLVTRTGEVIDEISFSSLKIMDDIPDYYFKPAVDASKYEWRSRDVPPEAVKRAFVPRDSMLPAGFRVLDLDSQDAGGADKGPRTRFIVSDGVTWVSVFIAPADRIRSEGRGEPMGTGISETYVRKLDKHYVTVVGDVPAATVKAIALAVQPE